MDGLNYELPGGDILYWVIFIECNLPVLFSYLLI